MTGTTISHYRIVSELGKGGMGVVYRAQDTKLDRTVALKLLAPHMLASEADRNRFYREARAAAALHHPNIATVFEIDETEDGRPFIAMEYIDGRQLDEGLTERPLPVTEAVRIAVQIAEALKVAHEHDIVHRDVKSANVMLTKDGVAKVLDFGLAKTNASTKLTQMGSTVGTVAYMSPEQARGEEVDQRTDLWSLGAVLYEMLTGQLPFPGAYEQAVVYGILNAAPEPVTSLRSGVPMDLEQIVTKLLVKESEFRYQSAAGVLADLNRLSARSSVRSYSAIPAALDPISTRKTGLPLWGWGIVASALIVGALGAWWLKPDPIPEVMHFSIDLPGANPNASPSWSPDGLKVLYGVAEGGVRLVEYDLSTGRATDVAGTEGAVSGRYSPEGLYILFKLGAGPTSDLYRLPMDTDEPLLVAEDIQTSILDWISEDRFIFGSEAGVVEHDLEVEESSILVPTDSVRVPAFGTILSPDRRFVYFASADGQRPGMYVRDLETGDEVLLREEFVVPRFITNDWRMLSLDWNSGRVMDQPINRNTGLPAGPRTPHFRSTQISTALSQSGHILYNAAESTAPSGTEPMYWVDPQGRTQHIGEFDMQMWNDFDVAPDARRAVVEANATDGTGYELHEFNLETLVSVRLMPDASYGGPAYTADGQAIYFHRLDDGIGSIQRVDIDGLRNPVDIITGDTNDRYPVIDDSERLLVFQREDPETGWDIWVKDLANGRERPLISADGPQTRPSISADGRLFAFETESNSQQSVLLGEVDSDWLTEVGTDVNWPQFDHAGRTLYFRNGLTSVQARTLTTARPYLAQPASVITSIPTAAHIHFGPAPGENPVIVSFPGITSQESEGWRVILNWTSTLR